MWTSVTKFLNEIKGICFHFPSLNTSDFLQSFTRHTISPKLTPHKTFWYEAFLLSMRSTWISSASSTGNKDVFHYGKHQYHFKFMWNEQDSLVTQFIDSACSYRVGWQLSPTTWLSTQRMWHGSSQCMRASRSRAIHYKINDDVNGFHPVSQRIRSPRKSILP